VRAAPASDKAAMAKMIFFMMRNRPKLFAPQRQERQYQGIMNIR
jgi:hypothetical protein